MRLAALVLLLCYTAISDAQLNGKYTFRHLGQEDGLQHSLVIDIAQDEKGYIWIITLDGLQRYDGHRFLRYEQPLSQVNLEGTALWIDTVQHHVGVVKQDRIGRVHLRSNTTAIVTASDLLIEEQASADTFTIAAGQSLIVSNHALVPSPIEQDIQPLIHAGHGYINYILKDERTGNMWLPRFRDVALATPGNKQLQLSSAPNPTHPLLAQLKARYGNHMVIRFAFLDSKRNLWIGTWLNYIIRYDLNTDQLYHYELEPIKLRQDPAFKADPAFLVNSVFEDRQGNIWLPTDNLGLLRFDAEQNDFEYIISDDRLKNGLEYNFKINCIFQDKHDNLWVGTDRGINIFNPYRDRFQTIRRQDGNAAALSRHDINDVIETAEHEILVATWGDGIVIFDSDWNFLRRVHFDGSDISNMIWCFMQLDNGEIWAGVQGGAIHIYDPVKKTFRTIQPPESEYSTIRTMARDSKGNILMGLHSGKVIAWNQPEGKFYAHSLSAEKTTFAQRPVTSLFVDAQDRCWVSHETGVLTEYDVNLHAYTGYYAVNNATINNDVNLFGIAQFNDSTLLVGTLKYGLQAFNTNTKQFTPMLGDKLPPYSNVFAIERDGAGSFWFTTNFNLYRMNVDTTLTRFNLDDAILSNAFGSYRFSLLRDGRWVANSSAELLLFDPIALARDQEPLPPVHITNMKAVNTTLYIDSFINLQLPVVLTHKQNFFTIEFSSLQYSDLRQTNYYYRLREIDETWINAGSRPFADYTDIKPGEYVFEVKAGHGNTFSAVTAIPIVIRPPWWGTLWFRICSLALLAGILYWFLKKRIEVIRTRSELKHKIAESEMMALRAQMNPHFIFNCINSIDAMIQQDDKYRATTYLNKFAKLIRNVLDISRENSVPLSKDLETLQLYLDLEMFRHAGQFKVDLTADPELLSGDYKVPPLIIQPYVENAILHGLRGRYDGILHIDVRRDADKIIYTIEDNGSGRRPTNGNGIHGSKGIGMQISSDRIRLFNQEEQANVEVVDLMEGTQPTGTRVIVQLNAQE